MEVRCFSLSKCSHEFISTHHALHSSQVLLVLVVDTIEMAATFTGLRFPIQPVILKAWPYIWRARVSPRLARVGLGMVLRPGSEGHIISAGPPPSPLSEPPSELCSTCSLDTSLELLIQSSRVSVGSLLQVQILPFVPVIFDNCHAFWYIKKL